MIDIVTFRQRIGTFQPNVKHRRLRISRIPSYRFNRTYTLCLVINFLVSSVSDINWGSNHEPDLSNDFNEVESVQFPLKEVLINRTYQKSRQACFRLYNTPCRSSVSCLRHQWASAKLRF